MYKLPFVNMCSNIYGQILASLVMTKVEDESYGLYIVKRDGIHLPLVRHAMTLEDAFNKLKCVTYKKAKVEEELLSACLLPNLTAPAVRWGSWW
ncbi:hypothetical protein V6N12_009727 [Hibiscus sabdariffa]|uniref:Uncharacterized protein n=1 Tax=Hibiscus sabdariffa TaxID=183260 RepID=A0ABR2AM48_9ROSI